MPLTRFDPFREFDRMFDRASNQARQPSFPMDQKSMSTASEPVGSSAN